MFKVNLELYFPLILGINRHFTWPGFKSDVQKHIRDCKKCQLNNRSGGTKAPLCQPDIITDKLDKLAVDIVGPLPLSRKKYHFIFTCMDLATNFPFAIPMTTYTTSETAEALLHIITCFGIPLQFYLTRALISYQRHLLNYTRRLTSPGSKRHHTIHRPTAHLNVSTPHSRQC